MPLEIRMILAPLCRQLLPTQVVEFLCLQGAIRITRKLGENGECLFHTAQIAAIINASVACILLQVEKDLHSITPAGRC